MPTIKLDTVRASQIYEGPDGIRITRTGVISDIDTSGPPEEVFARVVTTPGMPAYNAAYPGTTYPNAKLRRRVVDAVDGVNNKVRFQLVYEDNTQGFAIPPVTFILSRNTSLIERMTEVNPSDGTPIVVNWQNTADSADKINRTGHVRYLMPFQQLVAQGWYEGEPPSDMVDALGCVNSAVWHGRSRGYWLYASQSDTTRDFGGSYNITLEFWSKVREDWSEYTFLREPNGRYIPISNLVVSGLRDLGYEYGQTRQNGITKVGPYPVADFSALFGF